MPPLPHPAPDPDAVSQNMNSLKGEFLFGPGKGACLTSKSMLLHFKMQGFIACTEPICVIRLYCTEPFLASPDALEAMGVSESVSNH